MRGIFKAVPAVLFLAVQPTAANAAQRVYVASTGVDTAPCTLTQPCRSFAAALASVDAGGEIVALDTAGYGAVTIAKSVTITSNPGVFAGIAAASGNAITIDGAGIVVALRGLQLNGLGAANGIRGQSAARIEIDDCVVSNFPANGIYVEGGGSLEVIVTNTISKGNGTGLYAHSARVSVGHSEFEGNSTFGLLAKTQAKVVVNDSRFVGNGFGLYSDLPGSTIVATRIVATGNSQAGLMASLGTIVVGRSLVSHNGTYGFENDDGVIGSYGDNHVVGNMAGPTSGAVTPAPQL